MRLLVSSFFWLGVAFAAKTGIAASHPGHQKTGKSQISNEFTITSYEPTAYAFSSAPTMDDLTAYTSGSISLTSASSLVTFDYGADVGGIPFFDIQAGSGQIEIKYSEEFSGLNQQYGDGAWTFITADMNTFRVETLEASGPGRIQSALLQGGQRWQTIRLLTNDTLSLSPGFIPTVNIQPRSTLPGSFSASKSAYSDVWGLGARVVQAACVDEGTQPATWNVTNDGVLMAGQQPGGSAYGYSYQGYYTMTFMTKIVRGGTGWRVLSADPRSGPYFVITSDYTSNQTYVNIDRALIPPNTLTVGDGPNLIGQPILPIGSLGNRHFALSTTISENEWYNITTSSNSTGSTIYINGTLETFVSHGGSGTWSFGPFMDQIAYYKDVQVVADNGTIVYTNDFLSEDVLAEYSVDSNGYSYCVDGAKRDRSVWTGDFAHTTRTIAATTYRLDYIKGLITSAFDWQMTEGDGTGLIATNAAMGATPKYKNALYPQGYTITDYQVFFLLTLGDYYKLSNDLTFLEQYWSQAKTLVAKMQTYLDPYSGLFGTSYDNYYFTAPGTTNATAPTALMALALRELVPIAIAIGDTEIATSYAAAADKISEAINTLMWNPSLGTYSISVSQPNDFSLTAIAFTIRAGIANATQAASSIAKLPDLLASIGYKDASNIATGATTQLSPNVQGFLLESLLIANKTLGVQSLDAVTQLLDTFYPLMTNQEQYNVGTSWEYLYPDGSPGLGLFTSLAHPWGSASTYILTEYVLGVQAASPGYVDWKFTPLLFGLALTEANGTVPTPQGNIVAEWSLEGSTATLVVESPAGSNGAVEGTWLVGDWAVNGETVVLNGTYSVLGGKRTTLIGSV